MTGAGAGTTAGLAMSDLTPLKKAWMIAAIPMSRNISSKTEDVPRSERMVGKCMVGSERDVAVFLRRAGLVLAHDAAEGEGEGAAGDGGIAEADQVFADPAVAARVALAHGVPAADVARERGKSIDIAGYEAAMDAQRKQARASSKFKMAQGVDYSGAKIGEGTAKKIREYRFAVDLIPERFVAEGLIDAFKKEDIENLTMLWVKAAETRDVIGEGLTALGAIVDNCITYRTVPETEDPTGARARLEEEGADLITFTSSSTVDHFFDLGIDWPENCGAASIGPVTSETLRKKGQKPAFEAPQHDIPGLVKAIVKYFKQRG